MRGYRETDCARAPVVGGSEIDARASYFVREMPMTKEGAQSRDVGRGARKQLYPLGKTRGTVPAGSVRDSLTDR